MKQYDQPIDWAKVNMKASAAALNGEGTSVTGIVAEVDANGTYLHAQSFDVHVPIERTEENAQIYEVAAKLDKPIRIGNRELDKIHIPSQSRKKVGRNAPCPCGSEKKYKKCHGR